MVLIFHQLNRLNTLLKQVYTGKTLLKINRLLNLTALAKEGGTQINDHEKQKYLEFITEPQDQEITTKAIVTAQSQGPKLKAQNMPMGMAAMIAKIQAMSKQNIQTQNPQAQRNQAQRQNEAMSAMMANIKATSKQNIQTQSSQPQFNQKLMAQPQNEAMAAMIAKMQMSKQNMPSQQDSQAPPKLMQNRPMIFNLFANPSKPIQYRPSLPGSMQIQQMEQARNIEGNFFQKLFSWRQNICKIQFVVLHSSQNVDTSLYINGKLFYYFLN